MALEALQEIDSATRRLGGRIVALTSELERYTRALHKKLNLTFDILTEHGPRPLTRDLQFRRP
jgi:hypothetical protein